MGNGEAVKAFSVPEIFTAFVRDFVGIELEIDTVEKDKIYDPPIGKIAAKFVCGG